MSLMAHPALSPLFDAGDRAVVMALRDYISPERLSAWQDGPGTFYADNSWQTLGNLGLFRLALPDTRAPGLRDMARAVVMMSDTLTHDVHGALDLAVYVHGLVALHTLQFFSDRPAAQALLPDLRSGHSIFCTAYTDADPALPTQAEQVAGGYLLTGCKWLSVNMPQANHAVVTFDCGKDRMSAVIQLSDAALNRQTLHQAAGNSIYSQGAVVFDGFFVPADDVLAGGLRRLRVWNRVMTASRLLNTVSAHRSFAYLISVVVAQLAQRPVAGRPFQTLPQFRRWLQDAQALSAVLEGAIVATLQDMVQNRVDEPAIAGLKALAVQRTTALALQAQDLAGGAGTLANNDIALVVAALTHHKFSSGGEAQLMALYATSLSRKGTPRQTAA